MVKLLKKKSANNMFQDFSLNILASLIITFATQILVYPYLSRLLSNDEYGLILTIMGVVNVIGVSLGNPLNNTRILMQKEYEEKKLVGDYNIIFIMLLIINLIAVLIVTTIIFKEFNTTVFNCMLISSLILFRAYYSVSFRININYKKNLYLSIYGFFGYLIGLALTYYTQVWSLTFLIGELVSCVYLAFTSHTLREKVTFTPVFKKTVRKFLYIFMGSALAIVITYMDRFFIYPILGAHQVAIYNVASFLGKTAGIIIIPITGVLLTYYSKESSLTIRDFYKRVLYFFSVTTIFYLGIILLGKPIISYLYPTLYKEAMPYFYIANLIAALFIFGNTIHPTLLRFCNAKWQPIIQGIYFILYIIIGYLGMVTNGLMGFCIGIVLVNIFKVILMLLITTFSLKQNRIEH
ncbi:MULTISPECIES: lipopolysaccharide biosynthesis protein [unclassified Exiguobacterium]|uniref:lipopolysaccharide biosynthesis protein n=1 Tax=unclassified Exiguobacterium TaxID=2644629 RepID=UPI00103FA749|nr:MULTISPECIES: oligosaccharide flippase family protein [unclassified Exiguobacterium]TCI71256.1 hypothetical protein EVJ19_05125 [Exiguobacterium sp. IPCI3]TCI81234.1 hypothetical protein EVJ18_05125 [Exiguobacterium sp. IPCH1]TCI82431.1 hypothetical protein EVJ17_05125 [Exiguobacterium sp. IPBC4]